MIKHKRVMHIKHLNTRMIIYYIGMVGIAMLLFSSVISSIFADRWKEEMKQVVIQKTDLVVNEIDKKISEIRNIHHMISENQTIVSLLKKMQSGKLSNDEKKQIYSMMQQYKAQNADIVSCLVTDSNGVITDNRENNKIYESLINNNLDFEEIVQSRKIGCFSEPTTFPLQIYRTGYSEKNTITYYGRCYDTENYNTLGFLLLNLKKNGIFGASDQVCQSTFFTSAVFDEYERVIYVENDKLLEIKNELLSLDSFEDGVINKKIGSMNCLVFKKEIPGYPDWKFIGVVSVNQFNQPLTKVFLLLSEIALVMFLIISLLSYKIARGITQPVYRILSGMKELGDGKFPEALSVSSEDEMKELTEGFNTMVLNIKSLQERLITEQKKQKAYEITIVKSRLEILQSQINPHFIHNTLNTMKYMAQKEGNEQLVRMIVAFNTLLRTSMSNGNDFITVTEEIDNMNHYLEIQKQRYDSKISIQCYVLDDMDFIMIPKLILQPLVENSLFHGIIPKGEGTILISFSRQGSYLLVSVSDNGVGIPQEKQKTILQKRNHSQRGYTNIGLPNVNERLKMYYGQDCQLHILSSSEFGTFISFLVPIENREEGNSENSDDC